MIGLWNEESVAQATGGHERGHFIANRVEIDSRRVQLGDLFVAIVGERVDGHTYIAEALSRGAVAALVSYVPEGLPKSASLVVVADTLAALAAMGRFNRARSRAKIVGVTGSVGKTSTKEMLKLALSAHGKTYATTGNFNNHIGTPLNLANFSPDAAFGVFEMGMNHAGEIRHLVEMVRPHVAIVTNVEAVHLEFFKDISGIAAAKAEIFEHVEPNGVAILPADNAYFAHLAEKANACGIARKFSFGVGGGADVRLLDYRATENGAEAVVNVMGETLSFAIGASGRHFVLTAACVLAAAKALELPLAKTAASFADYREADGRGKLIALPNGAFVLDDSYNASPASMKAAIAKLDELWVLRGKKGRKLAALGDMLELGAEAPALHAGLSESLIAHGVHKVFTSGPLMKHLEAALPSDCRGPHVQEALQLAPLLKKTLEPNDILLVKGSHGSKMYALASILRDALASAQDQ